MYLSERFRAHKMAAMLSSFYCIGALCWVLFSDTWEFGSYTANEAKHVQHFYHTKAILIVLASTAVIFIMVSVSRKKIIASRRNYQSIFYHHPNPMWIYDSATLQFLEVNDSATKLYGYSRREFTSMHARDIRPAEEEIKVNQFVSEMKKGASYTHIWKHRKKNGETIMVEATTNELQFDKKPCYLISIKDITERNLRDEKMKKLSLVARHSTTSMIILDREGVIEWVNQPFSNMTGYTLGEVTGKKPQAFLHGPETDPATRIEIKEAISRGESFVGEIVNYHKDGHHFWLNLTISPVIKDGIVVNFVTIQTDITRIKQQNISLREIAFCASHQFRKPLANIIGIVSEMEYASPGLPQLAYLKQSATDMDKELSRIIKKTSLILKKDELVGRDQEKLQSDQMFLSGILPA